MNRRKKLIIVVIVAVFIMMVIAPSMVQQQQTNVRNDSVGGGCGHCGGTVDWKDIFGTVVLKHTFSVNWEFCWTNGSLIKEYTPLNAAHAIVPIVSWVHVCQPGWIHCSSAKYQAYGDVEYHIGLWELSFTQTTYSAVTVDPNSYGSGHFSYGSGEHQ